MNWILLICKENKNNHVTYQDMLITMLHGSGVGAFRPRQKRPISLLVGGRSLSCQILCRRGKIRVLSRGRSKGSMTEGYLRLGL